MSQICKTDPRQIEISILEGSTSVQVSLRHCGAAAAEAMPPLPAWQPVTCWVMVDCLSTTELVSQIHKADFISNEGPWMGSLPRNHSSLAWRSNYQKFEFLKSWWNEVTDCQWLALSEQREFQLRGVCKIFHNRFELLTIINWFAALPTIIIFFPFSIATCHFSL